MKVNSNRCRVNINSEYLLSVLLLFTFWIIGGKVVVAQSSDYLPSYTVKSAKISYTLRKYELNDTSSHPYKNRIFDRQGALVKEELLFGVGISSDNPVITLYKNNDIYWLNNPVSCATKRKIGKMSMSEIPIDKLAQDLIHGVKNKSTDKAFRSFTKKGNVSFLGHECTAYEYTYFNSRASTIDKTEMLVYHDICLAYKLFWGDMMYSKIEASSFQENIFIDASTFTVPDNLRIIDGDKLEEKNKNAETSVNTAIIEYNTLRDYGGIKESGKKTLYWDNSSKTLATEWVGTIEEFGLAPENKHKKDIHDSEYEYSVDYNTHKIYKRNLIHGNYNDKSIAELNYIFSNQLYDNSVKKLGTANFLGKECTLYEIQIGVEKLEVYEWQGLYLKIKKYLCMTPENSDKGVLMMEETAIGLKENPEISKSIFQYPEEYQIIAN